jgi:hypothetical protein
VVAATEAEAEGIGFKSVLNAGREMARTEVTVGTENFAVKDCSCSAYTGAKHIPGFTLG